jgi:hypothetical protein
MSDPEVGGGAPIGVEVETGKIYWWCARALQAPAVLRWIAQSDHLRADRIQGCEERQGNLLHMRAQREEAALRRQP